MSFRLDHLSLRDFRQFRELDIDFHPELTVLSARNGGGKTSLVDAIVVALEPFLEGFGGDTPIGLARSDISVRRAPDGSALEVERVEVSCRGRVLSKDVHWTLTRRLRGRAHKGDAAGPAELLAQGERYRHELLQFTDDEIPPPKLPILAVYGTHRLSAYDPVKPGREPTGEFTARLRGYDGCLSDSVEFASFGLWFKRLSMQDLADRGRKRKSVHHPADRLRGVRTAVDALLKPTGWGGLAWSFDENKIVAAHPKHGELPVRQLSDGIKGILSLAADIAHRCVRLNPQYGADAPKKTAGVVVIDEVDLFLHPEWQQTIIGSLRAAFPKIQFILTTHSPQVLSTVNAEHIRVISVDDAGFGAATTPTQQTRGVESAEVLAEVMGVDPVPHVPEAAWLSEYSHRVQDGTWEEPDAQALRAKLINHFGEKHPAIRRIDTLIAFKLSKRRIEAARTRE